MVGFGSLEWKWRLLEERLEEANAKSKNPKLEATKSKTSKFIW